MKPTSSSLVLFAALVLNACADPGGGGVWSLPQADTAADVAGEVGDQGTPPSSQADTLDPSGPDNPTEPTGPGDTQGVPDASAPDASAPDASAPDTSAPPEVSGPEVSTRDCPALPVTSAPALDSVEGDIWIFGGRTDLGVGGPGPDYFALQYFSQAPGSFSFADEIPTAGCQHCTLFTRDFGTATERSFRPVSGTVAVSQAGAGDFLDATYVDVVLADEDDLTGGECYRVDLLVFRAERGPTCTPDCTAKICGDDGCGGTCGQCDDGRTCAPDQRACVGGGPVACTELVVSGPLTVEGPGSFFIAPLSPGNGNAVQRLYVQDFVGELGFFDLASPINQNYATCEQCVLFAVGLSETGLGDTYFQTAGTISIAEGSDALGNPPRLDAQLLGVELRQVAIDPVTWQSSLVEGGGCFTIAFALVSTN